MESLQVAVSSSPRKRAKTWEISDSEDEEPLGIAKGNPTNRTEQVLKYLELSVSEGGLYGNTEPKQHLRDDQQSINVCAEELLENSSVDHGLKAHISEAAGHTEGGEHPSALTMTTLSLPPPKSTTPSPVKKTQKKSPEQLEAERMQAEERKKQKELKHQEKERIKELEKEEKQKRREFAQALKLMRPEQSGKYMIVQMDAGLLQDAGSDDVLEALHSARYNYSIEPQPVPCSFTWRREMPADWTCIATENPSTSEIPGSAFGIAKIYPEKKITLTVLGLQDYRRYQRMSLKMERQSQTPRYQCNEQLESYVTWQQIDEALVFLQLYHETQVVFLDTWKELGQHVCHVTKSVAQRPFRLLCEDQSYSFCTTAGTWRGWGPRGSLVGLPLAWRRQIQQFNRVSPSMAAAITEAYPSPQLLMQAYECCTTDKERLSLLSNLTVTSNAGATEDVDDPDGNVPCLDGQDQTRERRIGPDLSRRIWLFMSSNNPELALDLSS
ncbi:probable crossover junction endonuclease EME2 isoform X2 [Hyperolius riggenbachi]|uniref:probable crossover junction endonuclease EME2 isoform X2 n=1 Tax=Hyperolius riggenbachi TaxID=752182 RepID=UPI0035A326DA